MQLCNPCQSAAAPSFFLYLSILSTLQLTNGQAAEIDLTFSSSSCSNEWSGGVRHEVTKIVSLHAAHRKHGRGGVGLGAVIPEHACIINMHGAEP